MTGLLIALIVADVVAAVVIGHIMYGMHKLIVALKRENRELYDQKENLELIATCRDDVLKETKNMVVSLSKELKDLAQEREMLAMRVSEVEDGKADVVVTNNMFDAFRTLESEVQILSTLLKPKKGKKAGKRK